MTLQVHWNGQEDPSGHSCPPEPQLRRHKDGWSLDGISGVYSHFWEESAKQLMVPMTLQVHWNGWEDPSGHSCPPQLQLRRHKDNNNNQYNLNYVTKQTKNKEQYYSLNLSIFYVLCFMCNSYYII